MDKWTPTRIGDICKTNQKTYSTTEKWEFVNYLDTGNITENRISDIQHIVSGRDTLPSRARRKVDVGDILYSTVRPNQRHYGIVKCTLPNMLVSTGFAVISSNNAKADRDFLYYYLTQDDLVENLHAIGEQSVSAYPSIKPSDIENVEILLPPLDEQFQIGQMLRSLDDKIERNNMINHNLEQTARAIFKSWFVDFEPWGGERPAKWTVGSLLDIADYLNGLAMQRFRPADGEVGLPVLKIKELRQKACDTSSELCSPNVRSEYIVRDGDIIFSWSGSLLVDIWCGGECGLNQHLFKVTSSKYSKWFYYLWTCHHLDNFVAMAADKATTMGHIKREALERAEVLIPSETDYQTLDGLLSPIMEQMIIVRIDSRKLTNLRDTLLPRLMSGELTVDG
ncbi:restriction endonuclease [Clostridia bacterium]|nr:restriction endonuclease [Clostridia bacterium]